MVEMGLAMVVREGILRMRLRGVGRGMMMRGGNIFCVLMQGLLVERVGMVKGVMMFFLNIVVRSIVSLDVEEVVFL
jgi:hypothetical protein